ncbi:MAG: hypothetical protein RLZZ458_496 [Planctomycetota bacterium]
MRDAGSGGELENSGALLPVFGFQDSGLMKLQQFLEHYGVRINPFSQEDAQSDHIFQHHCAETIHHPAWDKVLGDCRNPSTAIVFGEKGAGKTAIRLQLVKALQDHNEKHPTERVFVISYDDLNPFLDAFRDRLRGRRRNPDNALREWRLWDHMDAILTLCTRRICSALMDQASADPNLSQATLRAMPRQRKRDLLLLAAFYDQSSDQAHARRWQTLRKHIGYSAPFANWRCWLGTAVTLFAAGFALRDITSDPSEALNRLRTWWFWLIIVSGWFPWVRRTLMLWWRARQTARQIRIIDHGAASLRQILGSFPAAEIDDQPIPSRDRSDDRYELLGKLQRFLKPLGWSSIIVLVDRVDEPHLINGSAERMRDFLWSMFDNKFLKHPGIGFKMLLPRDVVFFLSREEKEFYERSRLDKQNLINSLEWTGESLFDMATNRIRACLAENQVSGAVIRQDITIRDFFADDISRDDLIRKFAKLRVPRHLFRFLYQLLTAHCNRATEDQPSWKINRITLETVAEAYSRELEAFDRGLGTG